MADSDKEFVTEGWVCSGDSGGGAFDQHSFTAGTPFVLGALGRARELGARTLLITCNPARHRAAQPWDKHGSKFSMDTSERNG